MTTMNCEYVREVYPDVLNGVASRDVAQKVRAHIVSCDECQSEIRVIEMIHGASVPVPVGLDARVTRALRTAQPRWRIGRSELAMAATLAAAVIGGSILMKTQPTATVPAPQPNGFGFVSVEDAMISGASSLDDLSVEELEKLLGEMES